MLNLDIAVCYDCETLPNAFTLNVVGLYSDLDMTFEISEFRDDRETLRAWFEHWQATKTPMVGFNNLAFDYPVIHEIYCNPYITVAEIYYFAMGIINASFGGARFNGVWESDRFAPQIDVYKVHHFDNRAKSTSLKALQFNMRSESVMEMPIPFGVPVTREQVDAFLIPYNKHDVIETKKFALISMDAINFRNRLTDTLRGDVLNFNDTKIGAKILEQRLGDDVCYFDDLGRRAPRQTFRESIRLNEIIFPYIQFRDAEFNRILSWMRQQTLTADELTENIKTKGVFTGVSANVGGLDFHFGTGGIHGSVSAQRFASDTEYVICDVDVAALYPSIAIVNRLYPEHLGDAFVREYAQLPIERSKHAKGTVENAAFKLAANGTYGNSNNKYSVFYDPKFTMAITINGQLLLCMLAERLLTVDTLRIIQINTDGITYRIRRDQVPHAELMQQIWQRITHLTLEQTHYSRMWIRDVNNYVAETIDGKLKQKGAYWFPVKFPDDVSNASPPAWHKDFSALVSIKAAVDHMVNGTDIERFVYAHREPFDFMCRAKVDRSSHLYIGDKETQRITRYYVALNGGPMRKVSPPIGEAGTYKRRNGISDAEWHDVLGQIKPGTWDERIHTKNKSRYETREFGIEAGFNVTECNVASRFDFANVNYEWYIERARKLVI